MCCSSDLNAGRTRHCSRAWGRLPRAGDELRARVVVVTPPYLPGRGHKGQRVHPRRGGIPHHARGIRRTRQHRPAHAPARAIFVCAHVARRVAIVAPPVCRRAAGVCPGVEGRAALSSEALRKMRAADGRYQSAASARFSGSVIQRSAQRMVQKSDKLAAGPDTASDRAGRAVGQARETSVPLRA